MQSDGNDDAPETRPAEPSVSDSTRTREPVEPSHREPAQADPISATRLRDADRYQVLGEHGRGGLGRVSRAHDRDLGRDIAIKELISRGHISEVRFLREALITARLEHPGIVPVYEAGRWADGTPFYAMKLVAGRSLRELIAERTTVEDRLGLLHHVIAVADAIAYAHGRNIIHRDLKPANIIAGEFGETIVIDWGLAKDLSAAEESTTSGGPFRRQGDDGLTSTGSVLGTPAYMAPEQARGEPVDQRADVFALGVMLWQLCSLQKLPPGDTGKRAQILRRAGIDPDLTAIIVKALDPEPARRYPHAGAIAADLKAFKAGARITARRYSPFARLVHWTRRHRALAVAVVAATALATLGVAIDVARIAAERDRVRVANDSLILEHARLLLHSDPTQAFELLQTYRGADTTRAELLRAEARGLGVARLHVTPHTRGILFAQPIAGGTVITLGADGVVVRTSDRSSPRVIARGATSRVFPAYAASQDWFAYGCEATTVCVLDVRTERMRPPPAGIASFAPLGLAFSPSGELLAAISSRGELAIWQVGDHAPSGLRFQAHLEGAEVVAFVDDTTLVTRSSDGIRILDLDATGAAADRHELSIPAAGGLTTSSDLHLVAVTTTTGELVVVDSRSDRVVQRQVVCQGDVQRVVMLPGRSAVGYACQSGDVGAWDLAAPSASRLMHVDSATTALAGSADGRYLIEGGIDGSVVIHDATTGRVTTYIGHPVGVWILLPPTPEFPYITSGDSGGELRTWPLPDSAARVALRIAGTMSRAFPLPGDGPVIAIGSTTIAWYRSPGQSGELAGHDPRHNRLAVSKQQPRIVAYGFDDELELWSFEGEPTRRTVKTHHGPVASLVHAPNAPFFTVASRDGSLEEWSSDGQTYRELGSIHEPASFLFALPGASAVVVYAASGALWLSDRGNLSYLGRQPGIFASIAASNDSRCLAIADPHGVVRLHDLRTREISVFSSPHPSSQFLMFTPDSTALAIATNKGVVLRPVPHAPQPSSAAGWSWNSIELPVSHIQFSDDGAWFTAITDHGIWFQRHGTRRWIYYPTGTSRLQFGYFSSDGRRFVATDAGGIALVLDMHAGLFEDHVSD